MAPVRSEGSHPMRNATAVRRERRSAVANMSLHLRKISHCIAGVAIVLLQMVLGYEEFRDRRADGLFDWSAVLVNEPGSRA